MQEKELAVSTPQTRIRAMVRGAYALQQLRIQMGNRIVAAFRKNTGLESSRPEEDDPIAKKIFSELRDNYDKIMDGLVDLPSAKKFRSENMQIGLIKDYSELLLMNQYVELEQREETVFKKHLPNLLSEFPIWTEYLEKVEGCGTAMAAVIISEIDIHKASYSSSLWAYAGLDTVVTNNIGEEDGRGRGRHKEHLVPKQAEDKDGNITEFQGLSFKPFLKTKLLGVLGGAFLKRTKTFVDGDRMSGAERTKLATNYGFKPKGTTDIPKQVLKCLADNGHDITVRYSEFGQMYHSYKNRIINMEKHKNKTPGHIHAMANRFMIKRFLCKLYAEWRRLEGLPVVEEYAVRVLGHVHHAAKKV